MSAPTADMQSVVEVARVLLFGSISKNTISYVWSSWHRDNITNNHRQTKRMYLVHLQLRPEKGVLVVNCKLSAMKINHKFVLFLAINRQKGWFAIAIHQFIVSILTSCTSKRYAKYYCSCVGKCTQSEKSIPPGLGIG